MAIPFHAMAAGRPAPSEVAEVYQRFFVRQSRVGQIYLSKSRKARKDSYKLTGPANAIRSFRAPRRRKIRFPQISSQGGLSDAPTAWSFVR
jgi:hypothetical protein